MFHYIVVRRDLDFGVTLAQVSHASADSMQAWCQRRMFDLFKPHAAILGARTEAKLLKLEQKLLEAHISHVAVREPDLGGQLTAIGCLGEKDLLAPFFNEFQLYRVYDYITKETIGDTPVTSEDH